MSERQVAGFTAVNGKESRPDGIASRLDMGRSMGNGSTDRPEMAGSKSASSTEPSPTSSTSLHHPRLSNGHQHQESLQTIRTRSPSPGKRKRTLIDDGRDLSGPNSHYDLSPPRPTAPSIGHNGERRGQPPQEPTHGPEPSVTVNGTDPALSRNSHSHDDPWSAEREGRESYQANGVHQQLDPSDVRMAEALQQETRGSNTPRPWGVRGQHDEESPEQYGSYSAERTSGAIQSGPKRKRVFSNRTKTGCLTCRKRKKKCDEMHPYCNNCMKGGFTCEGYSTRTTWPKQTNGKNPKPLQAKEGYVEADSGYAADSPSTRQGGNPYETSHNGRPVASENEHQSHYVTSPSSATTRNGSYQGQNWSNGYATDTARPGGLPSISSLTTRDPRPYAMNQMPDLSHGHAHSSSQPTPSAWPSHHPNDEHRLPFGKSAGPVNSRSLQGVARDSLNMEESTRSSRPKDNPDDHKANMLNGLPFLHSAPVLIEDRKRCKLSLRQFHDAENPSMNIADSERHRKLVEIFVPPPNLTGHKADPQRHPIGSFGHGSVVETPFRCQYGYNIKIAENVFIGENCSIVDACGVIIGAKTWIGQNVQILTAMAQTQMQTRPAGNLAMWQGKRVHIEEDVHIGAGAIIYPGVTIGAGAMIEPGTIVKQDVPRWKQAPMMEWMNEQPRR